MLGFLDWTHSFGTTSQAELVNWIISNTNTDLRMLQKLEETQKAIFSVNVDAKVKVSSLDVTDKDLLEDAVRDCVEHFGSLDIVVNNGAFPLTVGLNSLFSAH